VERQRHLSGRHGRLDVRLQRNVGRQACHVRAAGDDIRQRLLQVRRKSRQLVYGGEQLRTRRVAVLVAQPCLGEHESHAGLLGRGGFTRAAVDAGGEGGHEAAKLGVAVVRGGADLAARESVFPDISRELVEHELPARDCHAAQHPENVPDSRLVDAHAGPPRSPRISSICPRALRRSSAISAAITSGSGRFSASRRLSSLSQKRSRLHLSRA
jgi:hypothetical protein